MARDEGSGQEGGVDTHARAVRKDDMDADHRPRRPPPSREAPRRAFNPMTRAIQNDLAAAAEPMTADAIFHDALDAGLRALLGARRPLPPAPSARRAEASGRSSHLAPDLTADHRMGIRPYRLAPRGRYQAQGSPQTLAEGLDEYYRLNRGGMFASGALSEESAAQFRRHDICHVMFGLDTTLADEVLVDWRTRLSSDVGWAGYDAVLDRCPEVRPVFKRVGYATIALANLRETARIRRAFAEAARAPKQWPWTPPDAFLERRLGDLRAEFGIRVI